MGVYQRKGSKFWHVWIDGAPKPRVNTKIAIGDDAEERKKSRKLAEDVYHALMADRARGRFGLARELPSRTFKQQREWYAEHVSKLKRGTTREISMLKQLGLHFDSEQLRRIDQSRVREWRAKRKDKVSQSTIRREEALLKHLMTTAVPQYLASNPLTGMQRVRVADTDTRTFSRDEESRLLAALENEPEASALVICALDTLLRMSNVKALKRQQDHGKYIFTDTKSGTVKIPVSVRLRAALDALPMTGPYYFPYYAERANMATITMFGAACTEAKVQIGRKTGGVSFHCLRHTGATRMLEAGVDVKTVMQIGGWKNLKVMERYLHPTDDKKHAAVNAIA